ncbi:ABC transporter substrate-binding protein [Paenibacillus etheri]|uniref:ABC transporter substrate-binding protein n=1 Tax=Paenibacillus etheri TaxID=1306852 RepID=A0A0W1B390_9BACL|nr:ABC transporter substrate-binding protein [Paenibacillus etheri]KTD88036.1 ABC transporter substrate-binding protein [Paenibacillus etheri]
MNRLNFQRKWLIPLCLFCSVLILSSCGKASTVSDPSASSSNIENKQTHKLTIMLDWYPNAVHSFLYAAEQNGYFLEEGLDVEIQMPADSNDTLKLVAANQIDLALSYQPQVLMARSENIPVRSIAAIVRHPLNHLMVPQAGDIHSPKDLTGKQIGYSSIPLYEAMIRTMIQNDGGDPKASKLIDVGFDLIPAIATGQVDAIMGGFINHEQLILEKEGHPVKGFNPTDYGVPDYYELVLVASDQGVQNSESYFKKFLNAIIKGQQYVQENPEKALNLLLAHENATSPLDKQIEEKSLEILLPLMNAGDQDFGYQESASWEKVRQWLSDNDLLSTDIKAEDAFINL